MSYAQSHIGRDRGALYDDYYRQNVWEQYLFARETVVLDEIAQRVVALGGDRYLDFACGTGRICSTIESRFGTSVGVDVSEDMLKEAKLKLKVTRLVCANILENDVLGTQEFDLITSFRFFVNAEPELRRAVTSKLASHLAPGGIIAANIHQNRCWPYIYLRQLALKLRGCMWLNMWSVRAFERVLNDHGLKVLKVYPVGMLRVPRSHGLDKIYTWFDKLATGSNCLAALSAGPIVIACKQNDLKAISLTK